MNYYCGRQSKMAAVVAKSQETLLKTSDASSVLGRAGLLVLANNEKKVISQSVGTIVPLVAAKMLELSRPSGKQQGHFKGPRWTAALVFPYYDLPQRLVGIQFAGRDLEPANGDTPFVHLRIGKPPYEGGLYLTETTRLATDVVFAFSDPLEAAKYQIRLRALRGRHVSVTAWRHDEQAFTRHSWSLLRSRKIIHVVDKFDHRVLSQAVLSDGRIYVAPKKLTSGNSCTDALRIAERASRHWAAYFDAWAGDKEDHVVQELLIQLQASHIDISQMKRRLRPELSRRVAKLLSLSSNFKAIPFGNKHLLEERHDQWFLINQHSGQEKLVANAVLQIDEVIATEGTTFYRGVIRQDGKSLPFYVNKRLLRQSPANWMENYMAVHEFGDVTLAPVVERQLVPLAKQMHSPLVAMGCTQLGWSKAQQLMVLSEVGLKPGGKIMPVNLITRNKASSALLLADVIPGDVESWTVPSAENHAFWAVWLAIACNILSPLADKKRRGLLTVGEAASGTLATVGDICGCANITAMPTQQRIDSEFMHNWPCVGNTAGTWTPKELRKLLDATGGERNVCLRASESAAKIMAINGDFHVLRTSRAPDAQGYRREMTQRLLPAFLKWVMAAPSSRFRVIGSPVDAAAESVKAWLLDAFSLGGGIIDSAKSHLRLASSINRSKELADLLADWIVSGELPVSSQSSKAGSHIVIEREAVVVTSQLLNRTCHRLELPRLRPNIVTNQLRSDGYLVNELTVDGFDAWLISRNMIQKQLDTAGYATGLRVVG